jgi:hypothetical protein
VGVYLALYTSTWALLPAVSRAVSSVVNAASWVTKTGEGLTALSAPLWVNTFTVTRVVYCSVVYALVTVVCAWSVAAVTKVVAFAYPDGTVVSSPVVPTDTVVIRIMLGVFDTGVTLIALWAVTERALLVAISGVELTVNITPAVFTFAVFVVLVAL